MRYNPCLIKERERTITIKLRDIPLFHDLSESELASVQSCLREKTYEKGEILFDEGKSCERIFIVLTGRVKLYRTSSSGREQILETLAPGDTCACNPGSLTWCCSSTAEAVTACKVWFLSRDDYVRLVDTSTKLAHTLNRLFAERIKNFSSLIEEVSLKDVKKRLVRFLLEMLAAKGDGRKRISVRTNREDVLFIPFTREEIAQRIGTARETVARQLHQLKRSKLIEIKPYEIVIRNKEGLEKLLL